MRIRPDAFKGFDELILPDGEHLGWVCMRCAAIVWNIGTHLVWHDEVERSR